MTETGLQVISECKHSSVSYAFQPDDKVDGATCNACHKLLFSYATLECFKCEPVQKFPVHNNLWLHLVRNEHANTPAE